MRNFYDDEVARKLVLLDIRNTERVIEMTDDVIKVIKKFDGKVFNKRLEAALKKEVNDNIRVHKSSYNTLSICFYAVDRYVKNTPDSNGYSSVVYTHNDEISFCHGDASDFIEENNRIIAKSIIKEINMTKEKHLNDIADLKIKLEKVEEYKKEFEELQKRVEEISKEIPYQIKDYFDLYYRLRR